MPGVVVQFLSQYPGEAEFLMQPLSCIEVRSRAVHRRAGFVRWRNQFMQNMKPTPRATCHL